MSSIKTRVRALEILNKADKAGSHSSSLLQRASQDEEINFGLLQRLVKGTLQWRARLDDEIDKIIGAKKEKLPGTVRNILRMAAYQLLFLKKVPLSLVAQESVELAKPHSKSISARDIHRLINALRAGPDRPAPPKMEDSSAASIARQYSHPLWIVERWVAEIGADETIDLCRANNRPWPTCIRANTLKISPHQLEKRFWQEWVKFAACTYVEGCYRIIAIPKNERLHDLESFKRGLFQVQDESSSLVSLLVDPKPGEFVVDLCAAPGGKAIHLATLMKNRGKVLAVDISAKKLEYVRENSRRQGLRIIQMREADATKLTLREPADRVLVDAPCSGLGVIGHKADLRWAKNAAEITELTALQTKIINNAAKLVKPGGVLVYSTCTVEREENENVVEHFLETHKNFRVVEPPKELHRKLFTKEGYLRTWPHRHGMAGAFAAVLTRIS
jgi:16S rRNA (cytosine967-C5)-methyltransferase